MFALPLAVPLSVAAGAGIQKLLNKKGGGQQGASQEEIQKLKKTIATLEASLAHFSTDSTEKEARLNELRTQTELLKVGTSKQGAKRAKCHGRSVDCVCKQCMQHGWAHARHGRSRHTCRALLGNLALYPVSAPAAQSKVETLDEEKKQLEEQNLKFKDDVRLLEQEQAALQVWMRTRMRPISTACHCTVCAYAGSCYHTDTHAASQARKLTQVPHASPFPLTLQRQRDSAAAEREDMAKQVSGMGMGMCRHMRVMQELPE